MILTDPILCPRCGTNEPRRTDAPHRCVICGYVCCASWPADRVATARQALGHEVKVALASREVTIPGPLSVKVLASYAPLLPRRRVFYP